MNLNELMEAKALLKELQYAGILPTVTVIESEETKQLRSEIEQTCKLLSPSDAVYIAGMLNRRVNPKVIKLIADRIANAIRTKAGERG